MTGRINVLSVLLHNRACHRSNGHGPARLVCRSEATEHILASTILLATKRPAADSLPPLWLCGIAAQPHHAASQQTIPIDRAP